MQGTDQLFLVYRPQFYKTNGRQQLILTADFSQSYLWTRYINDKDAHDSETFTLNIPGATIETILSSKVVKGYVYRRYVLGVAFAMDS